MKLIGSNYYGEFNKTPLVDPSRPLLNKKFFLVGQKINKNFLRAG
jgi:hypothetical protein